VSAPRDPPIVGPSPRPTTGPVATAATAAADQVDAGSSPRAGARRPPSGHRRRHELHSGRGRHYWAP
jgi:hypothetical protein